MRVSPQWFFPAAGAVRAGAVRAVQAAAVAVLLMAGGAAAQNNAISVDGHPINITFEERNERVAHRVREIIEAELPALLRAVGLREARAMRIEVVDDMRPFRRAFRGNLPVWGVAFALLREQVIVVDAPRATRAWNSLENVIPHELSHLLLAQRVGEVRFPIWFLEGMAQWQAREWSLVDSWQLMNTVWSGKALPLRRLIDRYPGGEEEARAAYRVSYAAFTDLFDGRFEELPEFFDAVNASGSFVSAFESFFGVSFVNYMSAFDDRLERRYHSRLLVFQSGPLFSMASVLFLIAIARHQIRKRRRMKDLEKLERGLPLDDPSDRRV